MNRSVSTNDDPRKNQPRVEWVDASPDGPPSLQQHDDSSIIDAELVSEEGKKDVGPPCKACGSPREGSSKFCIACGAPLETRDVPIIAPGESGESATALPDHAFECQNCGAQVATSVDQRSYVCPFCDSSYVTEISVSRSGRQRPEFVIGFAITVQEAQQKYYDWLGKNSWLRPGDLAKAAVAEKQKGVYVPFWHFSMFADSQWSANIGEHWYRTETYTTKDANGKTVTRTRTITETEWFPLNGKHHRYYYGFLVPATKGISGKEASAIQPYQLTSLSRYRPYFLAGWMAEEYSIAMDDAIQETKTEFRERQEREIRRFLPGDTNSGMRVQTTFDVNGSDLILLPVHVLSYRYRDKVYRFLVNGQTGKVVGEKPWSGKRISLLVAGIVLMIVAIVLAFVFLSQ